MIILLIVGLIIKTWVNTLKISQYFTKPYTSSERSINVKVDFV